MAKRGATTDLNHDNWDREEPPETAGTFQKASSDMMERRVIKVAKRRSATGSADQGSQKNVFSSFQGFKSDSTPNLNTDAKTTFSFLNSMSTPVNGLQQNQSSLNATTVSSSTNILNKSSANMNDSKSDKKYPAKLIRLNQCVANWIKSHVDKDPSCILTPIFKDYERYLKDIEEESNTSLTSDKNDLKDTTSSSNSKSNCLISSSSSNVTTSNFKFNQPSNNSDNISSSNSTSKSDGPFSGTGSFSASTSHSVFSSFKTDNSLVKASGGINALLAKPDAASLKINPFTTILNKSPSNDSDKSKSDVTFKLPQKVTEASGFSFSSQVFGNTASAGTAPSILGGSSTTTTTSGNKTNENEGEAEDSDEPPKVEFTPVQENDSVFNKRCKVFLKKENNYVELGVGTLFVKPVTGSKHQLIVRADTSLGNILVNVLLTPTIPIQRMGKNNVMVICVRIPPATGSDSPPAASTILLRVKTADEADELLNVLEKYKQV